MTNRLRSACLTLAVLLALSLSVVLLPCKRAEAQQPSWEASSVIYCVNPEIFSTGGLTGVTDQLTRIHSLGCNVLWLMPIFPRGQACTVDGIQHPSFNSPYCINNLEAVDPNVGTSAQLTTLITNAHNLGMKVILDMPLNCTSWDNPLVTSNPQYYLHSDGNVNNVASIETGWNSDNDIAQLNLTTNAYGAQTYVTGVCQYWLANYALDGFRFDAADDPYGSGPTLPQSLMQSINSTVNSTGNLLMLGEEQYEPFANAPYNLDYGWNMYYYGIVSAFTTANDESTLSYQWTYPYTSSYPKPSNMLEMNIQDDWDVANRDNIVLGGYAQAMAAAVWNCTITGVPLIYNGMEVANNNGGCNSHTQINWTGTNSSTFTTFYTQLLSLRNNSGGALQQGTTTFESSSSSAVIAYDRTGGGQEYFVEINTNGSSASGTVANPSGATWTDVTPAGAPGGTSHTLPSTGNFSLQAYDFAIFKRTTGSAPGAPSGLAVTPGNAQNALSWSAGSGATSYNIYRGTSSNGEGSTAIANVSSTSYTDTGLANGTTYYYKVAAVNANGTSGMSNEASGTPSAPSGGSLSGSVTAVTSSQAFNLTSQGAADWAAWGYGSGNYEHNSSGGSQISNASVAGGGSMNSFNSSFLGMTWTNGTPDSSVTNEQNGFYNNGGVGDGFQFTVPAGTSSQKLIVYVGGWSTGGTLTASLSDGSAANFTDSSQSNSGDSYYAYYTLTFNAGSAGKTLTVKWTENSGTGNVTLYAAALASNSGGSAPPAPTGLSTTAGNAQVALTWSSSTGATTYNVYRGTSAGGESSTPIATGISTTSYTNTGLTNGTTYYYKVAAVNSYGTSGMSNEQSATPQANGSLTGSVTAITSAQAFNLTTQGTTDWAAWGYGSGNYEHSSSGGSKVGNVGVAGAGSLNVFTSSYLGSTWTNGTPDTSVTNETNGFYNNAGVGDGFSFTVPAGTSVQHLTVYVGGWSSGGTLTASLSDGSAANYTDSSQSNSGNSYYAHYDLTFNAASAGKTLTVTWKEASGTGNVTIYAATLH